MSTDIDSPLYAITADNLPTPPTAAATDVVTVDQRLDRVTFGLDNIADAVSTLLARLAPVLAGDPHVEGDDQPEPEADGTAPITVRLHQLQANAHYLGDKIRAITNAVEL